MGNTDNGELPRNLHMKSVPRSLDAMPEEEAQVSFLDHKTTISAKNLHESYNCILSFNLTQLLVAGPDDIICYGSRATKQRSKLWQR